MRNAKKFATRGSAKFKCTKMNTKMKLTIEANAPITRKYIVCCFSINIGLWCLFADIIN